jgi:hypothetical protein
MFIALLRAHKRSQFGVCGLEKMKKTLTLIPCLARGTFKNFEQHLKSDYKWITDRANPPAAPRECENFNLKGCNTWSPENRLDEVKVMERLQQHTRDSWNFVEHDDLPSQVIGDVQQTEEREGALFRLIFNGWPANIKSSVLSEVLRTQDKHSHNVRSALTVIPENKKKLKYELCRAQHRPPPKLIRIFAFIWVRCVTVFFKPENGPQIQEHNRRNTRAIWIAYEKFRGGGGVRGIESASSRSPKNRSYS